MAEGANAALKEAADATDEWFNFDHPCLGVNRVVDAQAGDIELLTPEGARRKKFALIGFSSATRHMAPLSDPEWAVCGMNQLQRHLRHHVLDADGNPTEETVLRHGDLWFEIHKEWNTAVVPGTDHAGWLRDCNIPVFMTDTVEGLPTSVRFPVERLAEKFDIDYFTSTVAYMFSWAIDHIDRMVEHRLRTEVFQNRKIRKADVPGAIRDIYAEYTIGVFGIDLIVGEEYTDQRPCAEYWLGQAMARGIMLMIPEKSALLKQHYRYGYQIEPGGFIKPSDLSARRKHLAAQHTSTHEHAIELYGRLEELRNPAPDPVAREAELVAEHQETSQRAIALAGRVAECDYNTQLYELRLRGGAVQ